jgi:hypothetical protein
MPTFLLYTEPYTPFKVAVNRFYNTLEFHQYGPEKWFRGSGQPCVKKIYWGPSSL